MGYAVIYTTKRRNKRILLTGERNVISFMLKTACFVRVMVVVVVGWVGLGGDRESEIHWVRNTTDEVDSCNPYLGDQTLLV